MKKSYLILNEYIHFLDKGDREEKASESILYINIKKVITQVRWDQIVFVERSGFYDWTKASEAGCGSSSDMAKELDW
jgi:radical S-adenosyl methionine domain-containing protein 2